MSCSLMSSTQTGSVPVATHMRIIYYCNVDILLRVVVLNSYYTSLSIGTSCNGGVQRGLKTCNRTCMPGPALHGHAAH